VTTLSIWSGRRREGKTSQSFSPTGRVASDTLKSVVALGRSIYNYADSAGSSPGEQKSIDAARRALWDAAAQGTAVAGVPASPWIGMARRLVKAATYTPPDPRLEAKKEATRESKARHDALPGPVQTMLAEKNKLDQIGPKKMTDAERQRWASLRRTESLYQAWQKATAAGHADAAANLRGELEKEEREVNGAASTAR
jgi:hypothetical protein